MIKALFLIDIKRMKFYPELERHFETYVEEALMLGFPAKDGKILTPKKKNLWHFVNIRMKDHWDEFFRLLRDAVVNRGDELSLPIGREVIEDATPIEALDKDTEAEYNAHYEISGYKLDTVTDLNTGLPLSKQTIGITDDEAKCFIPHLDEMRASEIAVNEAWIDGGYDDYPNIAWAGVHGIECHHHIHENWVRNPKGELENIVELYQKYWDHEDFRVKADIGYNLAFLLAQGKEEVVGAYFRNKAMERHQDNPVEYMKDYHFRNRQEGHHGYWKEHLNLEDKMRVKGKEKVDRYLTRNLCAVLAVVLCRLQHGVKENLTSVAYFT